MCGDEITTGERYQDPQQEAEWLKAVYGPRVKIVLRVWTSASQSLIRFVPQLSA
jgi:hypothetical protein